MGVNFSARPLDIVQSVGPIGQPDEPDQNDEEQEAGQVSEPEQQAPPEPAPVLQVIDENNIQVNRSEKS